MKNKLLNKIILGSAQFGLDYGIANKTGRIAPEQAHKILAYAFDQGIECLDTANDYGQSESVIGDFLREYKLPFKIITKLSPAKEVSMDGVQEIFAASLRKLRVDHVEGCLIRHFKDFQQCPQSWLALENLKKKGVIKKIGFSLYYPEELLWLFERQIQFDFVQFPYSVFDQRFEKYLQILKAKNIEIHVRSVFLQGSVFLPLDQLPASFKNERIHFERLREIASSNNISTSSLCLNFVLLNPLIDHVVIGIDSLEHLQKNIQDVDLFERVSEIYSELKSLSIDDENVLVASRWGKQIKVGVIIQARMGSTRLPGKVLMKILDKTILEHVIERVKRAEDIEQVVIATSVDAKDEPIVELAKRLNVAVYRGSAGDVLDRYYQTAKLYGMQHIVRITADCPLMDPQVMDRVIADYVSLRPDYCSNTGKRTFPDGLDVEVFFFNALERAWQNACLSSDREHVTRYIRQQSDMFTVLNVEDQKDRGYKRWTLDHAKDFEFIKTILEAVHPKNSNFLMEDVLDFLENNPAVEEINKQSPVHS